MKKTRLLLLTLLGITYIGSVVADSGGSKSQIERGRYIIQVSGCNDCHTPGYIMNDGNTPVEKWLTGDGLGWRGPWGTTYGANLRLFVKDMTEDQWVQTAKTLKRRPPMPWFNLNVMNEQDLRTFVTGFIAQK